MSNDAEQGLSETSQAKMTTASSVDVKDIFQDEFIEEPDGIDGKSTRFQAIFNFINSIVGAGIIGLPFAIKECGFFMGIILLIFVAVITQYSVGLLIHVGHHYKVFNYTGLVGEILGENGRFIVGVSMLLFAVGAMCAYMIIIGDTVTRAFYQADDHSVLKSRYFIIPLFSALIILPVSCLRKMSSLSWSSLISITADFVLVVTVLFASSDAAKNSIYWDNNTGEKVIGIKSTNDPDAFAFGRSELFGGLGAMSFAFVCHHSTFTVHNSMKERTEENWAFVSKTSLATALFACLTLALAGYLSFFQFVQADVLNNFGGTAAITLARILLAVTMILTYPMEMFVARKVLHALIYGPTIPITIHRHYVLTGLLFVFTLSVGMATDDLGFVLEFTGAISASIIGYIVPPLLYMNTPRFLNSESKYEKMKVYGLIIFGVISMIAGSITAIVDVATNADECGYKPLELNSQQNVHTVIYQNCSSSSIQSN